MDENGIVDDVKFMDYKIKQLKETKEKVTYTLNLTLTKVKEITGKNFIVIHNQYPLKELIDFINCYNIGNQ